jgi:hypothetical protein
MKKFIPFAVAAIAATLVATAPFARDYIASKREEAKREATARLVDTGKFFALKCVIPAIEQSYRSGEIGGSSVIFPEDDEILFARPSPFLLSEEEATQAINRGMQEEISAYVSRRFPGQKISLRVPYLVQ